MTFIDRQSARRRSTSISPRSAALAAGFRIMSTSRTTFRGACISPSTSASGRDCPFASEQLSALFSSPLYTGFQADGKEHLPGDQPADDWRHWIPLIALFTGARLGEIAQLLTDDVRQLHGHWVFHITEEGDDEKNVKTEGSIVSFQFTPNWSGWASSTITPSRWRRMSKRLFPD